MKYKVACVQMDVAFGDPEANRKKAERLVHNLDGGIDLVVLPELWTTGYDLTRLHEIADREGEEAKAFLGRLARERGVYIVGGSVAKQTAEGITNTMLVFNPEGDVIGEYSKLHLFRLMDEHLYLRAGGELGLFALPGVTCAGVICYDIRFPEWIRAHAVRGAGMLFVAAEWPLPRLHHWRSLLISRAIENQCYVVACNRAGADPKNVFAGHSLIIDPWGEVVAEGGEAETVVAAEIDVERVWEVRGQIPVFGDRRPELYRD